MPGKPRATLEEYNKRLQDTFGGTVVARGTLEHMKALVKHKCSNGHKFKAKPTYLLKTVYGCPQCGVAACAAGQIKPTKTFKKEVKAKFGDQITVLGEYKNQKIKIKVRCNIHNTEYMTWPDPLRVVSSKNPLGSGSKKRWIPFKFLLDVKDIDGQGIKMLNR